MRRLVVPFGVSIFGVVAALLPAGRAPAAEAPTPAPTMEVTVGEGRLSVNLRDAPLADVLRLIGQEARLKVHLDGQLRTPITGIFSGLPLEAGIRRLTRGHSSTFAYSPQSAGHAARLTEIWIIESDPATPVDPRARAARLASLGGLGRRGDDGAVAELSRILAQDPDPVIRTQAALALSRARNAQATPALTAALGDQHPLVRIQAVHGLQRVEGERAAEALGRVLLSDPDPSVRRVAAGALASLRDAAAGSALDTAMSADGDASVRQAAAAAYRRWEQAVRPPLGR
jgi:HEAT repeats